MCWQDCATRSLAKGQSHRLPKSPRSTEGSSGRIVQAVAKIGLLTVAVLRRSTRRGAVRLEIMAGVPPNSPETNIRRSGNIPASCKFPLNSPNPGATGRTM